MSHIDMRKIKSNLEQETSHDQVSEMAKHIVSHHIIINRWRNYTEETCDASYHKRLGKPHVPMPYHCMVAESQFRTHQQAIEDIDRILEELLTTNLTDEERENGEKRVVVVLYWDARMETKWFHEMGFHVSRDQVHEWDFQKFKPFRSTFEKAKTAASSVFTSLGVGALSPDSDESIVYHNATNDTWSLLVAFLRCQLMTEKEWDHWHGAVGGCLEFVDLSWVGDELLKRNQELRPILQPGERPEEIEEDPEEEEESEPFVVNDSTMLEIQWGVAASSVTNKPERAWAEAVLKPPAVVQEVDWSSGWGSSGWGTCDNNGWNASSGTRTSSKPQSTEGESSGWRSTKTFSTAENVEEPAEKKEGTETSTPEEPNSLETAKAEESEWTVVGAQKRKPKKKVRFASKEPSVANSWRRQPSPGPWKRDRRSSRNNNRRSHTSHVPEPDDSVFTAQTAQTSDSKSSSVAVAPPANPRPLPQPSAAALHWAKFRSTSSKPVRRPD